MTVIARPEGQQSTVWGPSVIASPERSEGRSNPWLRACRWIAALAMTGVALGRHCEGAERSEADEAIHAAAAGVLQHGFASLSLRSGSQ